MQNGQARILSEFATTTQSQVVGYQKVALRVVFAGGATGGHVFPGLAVAEWLYATVSAVENYFIGTDRAVENRIVPASPHVRKHIALPGAAELAGNNLGRLLRSAHALTRSVLFARKVLQGIEPSVVVGLGGAASVPTVLAAKLLGIPIVLLEQNVVAGRANRFLARWADTACVGFAPAAKALRRARRMLVTGNPVRRAIADLAARPDRQAEDGTARALQPREPAKEQALACAAPPSKRDTRMPQHGDPAPASTPTSASVSQPLPHASETPSHCLLVLGGSQGSRHLNEAVFEFAVRCLPRKWWIWHQTGGADSDRMREAFARHGIPARVEDFIDDMATAWQCADLLIARAGALTISELCCAGCASVLVPIPWSADDHQGENARWMQSANAAVCVAQAATPSRTAERLRARARDLTERPELRQCLGRNALRLARPDAAAQVGSVILGVAGRQRFLPDQWPHGPRS